MSRAGGGRPTTAGVARVLTIATLTDAGLFTGKPGDRATIDLSWQFDGQAETLTGEAEIRERSIMLRISFTALLRNGQHAPSVQDIEITGRPQPFGGVQWLFLCPERGLAVRTLYRPAWSSRWGCRHYHGLAYASTRQGQRDRALTQSHRLRRQLDPETAYADPTPQRPKGMWRSTYDRRVTRIDAKESVIDAHLVSVVERLQARAAAP